MGMEDRDWYRDAQREKAKREQLESTKSKFERYSAKHLGTGHKRESSQTGLVPMVLFWLLVMGIVYALMQYTLSPKRPKANGQGEVVITRSTDGHFRTVGMVNGSETAFLIDTGASTVAVSDHFAAKASLNGGAPTVFNTANGPRPGRMVEGVTVSVGPLQVNNTRVGVGISSSPDQEALLGQSFLTHFNVTMTSEKLVLSPHR